MLDVVDKMLENEEFIGCSCFVKKDDGVFLYDIHENSIKIKQKIEESVDENFHIFNLFSKTIGESEYGGGESSDHGSIGFFYKKTNNKIDWFFISEESNPFIDVRKENNLIFFLSSSGLEYEVFDLNEIRIRILDLKN